jgi:hypothetical protein
MALRGAPSFTALTMYEDASLSTRGSRKCALLAPARLTYSGSAAWRARLDVAMALRD